MKEELKARAWAALESFHNDPEALDRGRRLVDEILSGNPTDAEGALLNGRFMALEGRRTAKSLSDFAAVFSRVEAELKRAIELGLDSYSDVPFKASVSLFKIAHSLQHGHEVGPANVGALLALDPQGRASRHYQKACFLLNYRPENWASLALSELDRAVELERNPSSLKCRATAKAALGDQEGAKRDREEARSLEHGTAS